MGHRHSNRLPVIYLLDGSRAFTGAFACARNMARALAGRAQVVLILAADSAISSEEARDFAEVKRLPITHLRKSPSAAALYLPHLLVASIGLLRHMRRNHARVLIVNDFYLMQGAVCRLFGFRGRIFTWVRINPAAFGPLSRIWLWVGARVSTQLVSVSRHIADLLPTGYKTEILHDAIECEQIDIESSELGAPYIFIFIGNYIPGKGQEIAIEAMSLVVQEFPQARVEFYGGDMGLEKNRSFRRRLEARSTTLGLADRLHFGDFTADTRAVMRGKFAALNLSQSESFSMAVLEASASGLPVIATRSGGPQEIVESGKTGYLIPLNDPDACAEAMIRLCRDPIGARRMGEAAREKVWSEFSHEVFRARLLSLLDLEKLVGEKPACAI